MSSMETIKYKASRSRPLTPLRYPGGKSAFAPFIKSLLEQNDLVGGHYLEPFAGGAGVAIDLLLNGYCSDIHINDFDEAIYHFWKAIVQDTESFLKKLHDTDITIEEWHRQKEILANPEQHSPLEFGFAAFFLNRTNRSGILKAGVIGGKNQTGNYKLDARFNKISLTNRIQNIAQHAKNIHIYNEDALALLGQVDELLPEQSLIYLDPPYYVKGQGLYRNFYQHDDHVAIKDALGKTKRKWIVSYDNNPEIKTIYKDYIQDEYILGYCAYHKTKGSEVMIYGKDLINPKI